MKKEALRLISILEHDLNLARKVVSKTKRIIRSGGNLRQFDERMLALMDFSDKKRKAKHHQYSGIVKKIEAIVRKLDSKSAKVLTAKLAKLKKFY